MAGFFFYILFMNFDYIIDQIGKVVLGKKKEIRLAITCLFAKGHLLIEDLPGIGKTTLAKALARCLGLKFQRVQFTSDMLPGDILGVSVFEQEKTRFVFYPGPIFTQVLLADEINRATPKTQSALLEAMEEKQVTIEGKTRALEKPFFVIATQNPLEQSGTFPLPESQLDRFLMRINLGYPDRNSEKNLLMGEEAGDILGKMDSCLIHEDVTDIQDKIKKVIVSDAFVEYLQDIIDFSRNSSHFQVGLSPRAGLGLLNASKSWAFIHGRDFVVPEDLQNIMPWVTGHRLIKTGSLEEFSHDVLMELFMEVPIP